MEENILTRNGCKNTRSRKAIVEVLERADAPISAEDIFMRIKETGLSTNLSTVYRTLDLMESKGLVEKTLLNENKARYELLGSGHKHHLFCTSCRKSIPINACPLHELEKDIEKKTSFDITGHRLEIYGVCPECQKA